MDKKSLLIFALGAVLSASLFASLFVLQIVAPTQPAQIPKQIQASQTLQKFKVSSWTPTYEWYLLVAGAGKEKGIWAKHGLDPEFVTPKVGGTPFTAADIAEQAKSGIKIGFNVPAEVLLARSKGVPVKIVASGLGETPAKIYVIADSPIKNVKDLDGKKIGIQSTTDWTYRQALYVANKFGIKVEPLPLVNITNQVVALKLGKVDAFLSAAGPPLRLVDSGELRIILRTADVLGKPFASALIYATEDQIKENPDLVRRFVRATLEIVKHLDENPNYGTELYMKSTGAPRDLAEKVVSLITWTPNGRGSGEDLVAALTNYWQYVREAGLVPAEYDVKIEDAVDLRFLP